MISCFQNVAVNCNLRPYSKVVQAGGLEVIIAHVVDASTTPMIRGEAARALWCIVANNAEVANEAIRGGAGLIHILVQMLTSAPPVAKAAAAGVIGAVGGGLPHTSPLINFSSSSAA